MNEGVCASKKQINSFSATTYITFYSFWLFLCWEINSLASSSRKAHLTDRTIKITRSANKDRHVPSSSRTYPFSPSNFSHPRFHVWLSLIHHSTPFFTPTLSLSSADSLYDFTFSLSHCRLLIKWGVTWDFRHPFTRVHSRSDILANFRLFPFFDKNYIICDINRGNYGRKKAVDRSLKLVHLLGRARSSCGCFVSGPGYLSSAAGGMHDGESRRPSCLSDYHSPFELVMAS